MPEEILHHFDKDTFNHDLLNWYRENKRTLPWRNTTNPYYIWISEIMLQQTKVDTVIHYYERFIKKFPTIYDLANADEQDVLKEWEGLGYYSRARNLQNAAKEVVSSYDGVIPNEPKQLIKLKGIGPYTQGAIASIAFGLPEPAVDGNVMRVLSRILHITNNISEQKTRKMFENIVREIINKQDPSSFNQGLMELGALICTPKSPACLHCPVRSVCRAYDRGTVEKLPVKTRGKIQRRIEYNVLIIRDKAGLVAIEKRPDTGLLANMWQFPMVNRHSIELNDFHENDYGIQFKTARQLGELTHVFSHIIWDLYVYETEIIDLQQLKSNQNIKFVPVSELHKYPFSVSHLKVMEMIK